MGHNYTKTEVFKKKYFDVYVSICPRHLNRGYTITDYAKVECFACVERGEKGSNRFMDYKIYRMKVIKELK